MLFRGRQSTACRRVAALILIAVLGQTPTACGEPTGALGFSEGPPALAEIWYAGKRVSPNTGAKEGPGDTVTAFPSGHTPAPQENPGPVSPADPQTLSLPGEQSQRAVQQPNLAEGLQEFRSAFGNPRAYGVEGSLPGFVPGKGEFQEWPGEFRPRFNPVFPNPLRMRPLLERPLLEDSSWTADEHLRLFANRPFAGRDETPGPAGISEQGVSSPVQPADGSRVSVESLAREVSAPVKRQAAADAAAASGPGGNHWTMGSLVFCLGGMALAMVMLITKVRRPYPAVMQIELINAKDLGQQLGFRIAGESVRFAAQPAEAERGSKKTSSAWTIDPASLESALAKMAPVSLGPTYADRKAEEAEQHKRRDQDLLKALFEHNLECLREIRTTSDKAA
ncbi:MAG: hypothetical protein HUU20_17590 [Pirellulales bacterium]|nr:hypothetical protein [Pirellulales bacterium]